MTTHHPTLIPLPDELRSPRLLLRPYRPADADQVFAAVGESRAHLRPWMGWVDDPVSVDNSRDWCARCAANWLLRAQLTVGIFAAASGRYLGCVSVHDPDWDLRAFGIEVPQRRSQRTEPAAGRAGRIRPGGAAAQRLPRSRRAAGRRAGLRPDPRRRLAVTGPAS